MAKYRCLTQTFIAPFRLEEGAIFTIDDDWQPGPHVEPLDPGAQAAMDKYYEEHPGASIHPIEDLPISMIPVIDETPQPKGEADGGMSLAEAIHSAPKPGPTDGGKSTPSDKPFESKK